MTVSFRPSPGGTCPGRVPVVRPVTCTKNTPFKVDAKVVPAPRTEDMQAAARDFASIHSCNACARQWSDGFSQFSPRICVFSTPPFRMGLTTNPRVNIGQASLPREHPALPNTDIYIYCCQATADPRHHSSPAIRILLSKLLASIVRRRLGRRRRSLHQNVTADRGSKLSFMKIVLK